MHSLNFKQEHLKHVIDLPRFVCNMLKDYLLHHSPSQFDFFFSADLFRPYKQWHFKTAAFKVQQTLQVCYWMLSLETDKSKCLSSFSFYRQIKYIAQKTTALSISNWFKSRVRNTSTSIISQYENYQNYIKTVIWISMIFFNSTYSSSSYEELAFPLCYRTLSFLPSSPNTHTKDRTTPHQVTCCYLNCTHMARILLESFRRNLVPAHKWC